MSEKTAEDEVSQLHFWLSWNNLTEGERFYMLKEVGNPYSMNDQQKQSVINFYNNVSGMKGRNE